MKLTADTNILVRAIVVDHPGQARLAQAELRRAEIVAVPIPVLCELAWVLIQGYKNSNAEVASAIRALANSANVVMNRPAAEAGLTLLEAGGDFADAAIAYEGQELGAETFMSFDKQAVKLLGQQGFSARAPS